MSSSILKKFPASSPPPPTPDRLIRQRALLWHSLGFATLVLLLWADELFSFLYGYFGGDWREVDIFEATVRSGIVILLWIISAYKVWQTLSRMSQLESMLHFCAWCNRVKDQDRWQTLEEHFTAHTGKPPSHGICPECAEKFTAEVSPDGPQSMSMRE